MINLLTNSLTQLEIGTALGERAPLLPSIESEHWSQIASTPLAASLFAPIRDAALLEQEEPLPLLTQELYEDFHLTGTRLPFENVYFARRRSLARTAICALLDSPGEQAKWTIPLIRKCRDIMSEESWALPAHVSSQTGKDPMTVDLFSAETANLMGELITVFGSMLPADFIASVKVRLRTTIFQNYIDHHQRLFWTDITNNWNAVCHQGVLGAALAVEEDTETVAKILQIASTHLPRFLQGFGTDGGCSEGPGYWQYGFGWFSALNQQIETASHGALSLFHADDGIREIALYYPRASFSNNYLVNFSDCPAQSPPNAWLLSYLGDRLGDDTLKAYGANAYSDLGSGGLAINAQRADFFTLVRLFRNCPTEMPAKTNIRATDHYFADLSVLTIRREDADGNLWEFAAKGGHNDEHHNHNDCGSYILNLNGHPIVTEIGAPEYRKEFFGAGRYEFLAARTLGHSLPIAGGFEQAAGKEFAARVLALDNQPSQIRFELDLAKYYPRDSGCKSLVRAFVLDLAASSLSVTDTFEFERPSTFESAITTRENVSREEDDIVIGSESAAAALSLSSPSRLVDISEHFYSTHQSHFTPITRISIKNPERETSGSIGYVLRPAK